MADQQIVIDIVTRLDKLEKGLQTTGRKVDGFDQKMQGGFNKLKIGLLATAAAVTLVVRGVTKLISKFVDYGLKIDKANKSTGVAVESLQKWAYIAEQEHGNFDTVTRAFAILGQRTVQASQGLETYTREFEHMGIAVYDASGEIRAADKIFEDLGTYIKGASNQSEALGHITNLLGARYAKELIPMLKLSDEELEKLGEEAEKLGIVLDQKTITATKKFSDELTKAKKGFEGAAMQLGAKLLPLLNKIPPMLEKLWPVVNRLADAGKTMLEAVIPLVESLLPALLPILDGLSLAIKGIAEVLKVFTRMTNDATDATRTLWNVIIKGQRMTAEEQERWTIKSALLTPGDATAKALGFKDREDMRNRLRAIELGKGPMAGLYGEAEGTGIPELDLSDLSSADVEDKGEGKESNLIQVGPYAGFTVADAIFFHDEQMGMLDDIEGRMQTANNTFTQFKETWGGEMTEEEIQAWQKRQDEIAKTQQRYISFAQSVKSQFDQVFGEPLMQLFDDTFGRLKFQIDDSMGAFEKFTKSIINNLIDMVGKLAVQGLAFAAIITGLNLIPPPGTIGTAFAKFLAGGSFGSAGKDVAGGNVGGLIGKLFSGGYDSPMNDAWVRRQGSDFAREFALGLQQQMMPGFTGIGGVQIVEVPMGMTPFINVYRNSPEADKQAVGRTYREATAISKRGEI